MRSPRLWAAMAVMGLLAAMAGLTLEGKFRQAVWILIFGLAARVVIAHLAAGQTSASPDSETPESH